ncbi:hypothetical protein N7474_007239 [Penicillium riverlandense]|uniref:uncharacterized protein n=1 Tax=Penicillium riverlandense TaxID=1903569 RepID=UPI0025498524|nr:uncharacterized protein N7474_007239 [Penicillium riverlandense]KAJ5815462.1 hypothetical protein N7474_007239 [Penicillium riverlandense]
MDPRRVSRGGVEKPVRSDPSSFTPKRPVTLPLSKKEPVIALGGIDLQLLLPHPQLTENLEQRSRAVLRDSTTSSPQLESWSTPPILSKRQAFGYRPHEREYWARAMPWLQLPASTPSMQSCSNLLDNILTTAEERSFLRGMMPETAFPSENRTIQPETESGSEASKCMPQFVAPSQVEYNPRMIGVPDVPEDEFLTF